MSAFLQGIPLDRVIFVPGSFNSVWIQDYGPWTVYQDKVGERGISDYRYNRPARPLDDFVPYELADFIGLPLYNADENPYRWVHTGGNFLVDGMGTAYSSDLVLRENSGRTGREIEQWAQVFFGIDDYRMLYRLPFDTIHHLDMHLRLMDEETIAVGYYPEG
ncbi:MAG: agmatine deiminase family protein [Saprospiraceae bacterium]